MAHDVFISYSSQDKAVADAVCATLERGKIRCWVAPRDVPAGKPYAATIEIVGDKASLYVDGEKVASTFFLVNLGAE